ncbi:glycosyltransferase family 2 protein [Francisella sp. XLW-1]|uniref:glycosyltransferase family 2 protein n=1 Tax=Francisella sp. XLW-1 TaxID=2610887 RepID=UPI00123E43C0|nr:glycosyltransferase [Francisella sp. XLW-1]
MSVENAPIISVVMPVYNAEKYISDAIESILNQTFIDFEFIIINDGSSDRSLEVIEEYKKIDSRIIVVSRENKGIVYSLNEGIALSRGKYIARMDADDISLPDRFINQVEFMDANPQIGVCGSWIKKFGKNIKTYVWKLEKDDKKLKSLLLFSVPVAHPSVFIRKSILIQNNLRYRENYKDAEDYKLWVDLAEHTKFSNIPKVLLNYRVHRESITQNANTKNNLDKRKEILNKIVDSFLKEVNPNFIRSEYEKNIHFSLDLAHIENSKIINLNKLDNYFDKLMFEFYSYGSDFEIKFIRKEIFKRFFAISYRNIGYSKLSLLKCFFYKKNWLGAYFYFCDRIFCKN